MLLEMIKYARKQYLKYLAIIFLKNGDGFKLFFIEIYLKN